jgi:hypothetical protein
MSERRGAAVTLAVVALALAGCSGGGSDDDLPDFVVSDATRFAREWGDPYPAKAVAVRTTWEHYRLLPGRTAPLDPTAYPKKAVVYVVRLTGNFTSYGECARAVNNRHRVHVVEVLIDAHSRQTECWQEEPPWTIRSLGKPRTVRVG